LCQVNEPFRGLLEQEERYVYVMASDDFDAMTFKHGFQMGAMRLQIVTKPTIHKDHGPCEGDTLIGVTQGVHITTI